jgi:hypothetical protein
MDNSPQEPGILEISGVAPLITAAAIIFSATVALATYLNALNQNRLQRRRETIAMVTSILATDEFTVSRKSFMDKRGKQLSVEEVSKVLNKYELLATAANEDLISARILGLFWGTTLIRDWDHAFPTIDEMRRRHRVNSYYCETEALVRKLESDKKKGRTTIGKILGTERYSA